MNKTELPVVLQIEKIVNEGRNTKTFLFSHRLFGKPGQFVMVWMPRIDEKPFSISYQDKERFAITVMAVGPFSKRMMDLSKGDKVGIRGPYGNWYSIKGRSIIIVGGGCGCAPTAFLAEEAKKRGKDVTFIIGARTKDALLFTERMRKSGIKVYVTTDDGTAGRKGYTTDVLKELLSKGGYDAVYTCGPEIMMKKIVELCRKYEVYCEASLERYMKCGFGVCGQCCLDPVGVRVCKEGPIFNAMQLSNITEFGDHRRDGTGKKVRS